jgi:hypothetical protein
MDTLQTMTIAEFKHAARSFEDPTVALAEVSRLYSNATSESVLARAKVMCQTLLNIGADRTGVDVDTTTEFGKWLSAAKVIRVPRAGARIAKIAARPDNAEHAQLVRIATRLGVRLVPAKGLALRIIRHLESAMQN